MKQKVTIKIPKELYEKLQEIIKTSGFSSVTEFIVFVMRTLAMGGKITEEDKFKKEDIKEIKKRLKKLGYI
jgi:metal-responsive CopG/Arc/MetJ family transcriptional regulator